MRQRKNVSMFDFFKISPMEGMNNISRKLIAAKLIIFFAYTIASSLTILTYLQGNMKLFYTDLTLLCMISLMTLLLIRKNIYWIANSLLIIMSLGIIWGTYINKGQDNVFYWGFLSVTFMMVSFGHKKGIIVASLFYASLFLIMAQYIGDTLSFSGYVRFVVVSSMIVLSSYFYEYSISSTLVKLNTLNETLTLMTKIDSLTGLYNRRYFDEIFEVQIKTAKRVERYFVFAMIDVDFFKMYNDTYGHLSGDEVLKSIAKTIQESLKRIDDYAFRLGGEEFGLCFSVEREEDAKQLLEDLRQKIEHLKIANIHNTQAPYVTVSIGFHVVKPYEIYDRDTLYKISDDALYTAKHKGRNRVEMADKREPKGSRSVAF